MEPLKRVLILNCGSSSLKWSLLSVDDESTLLSGSQPWAGPDDASRRQQLQAVFDQLPEPDAVGHRLVHGGSVFRAATRIDAQVRLALTDLSHLDPLHMQPALALLDAATARFPDKPQVAAFDTAFHSTLAEAASTYALPFAWTERWGLRRFGFHGLSINHAQRRAAEMSGGAPHRLVVCHLGSGCSVTAVAAGRCVDTSMGFTPLEGLVMSTRAGSIDPGLLLHLQLQCGIGAPELLDTLQNQSGLAGVSGVSGDLRAVQAAADGGSVRATLAYETFIVSAKRAVGAMMAMLGGIDALVFTGGIGENNPRVRHDITAPLLFAGVRVDDTINQAAGPDQDISHVESTARILVIGAREDLVILRETIACLKE